MYKNYLILRKNNKSKVSKISKQEKKSYAKTQHILDSGNIINSA